jgi:sterol desaturase/sphingolipid hydroxylase (fatty acid hydroxylase superfamily)
LDFSAGIDFFLGQCERLLFSLGSHFSLTSLGAALVVASVFYVVKRLKRGRRVRARTILRALFPRRIVHSRSNQADIGYLFFNVFVFGVVFGWAVLSYQSVSNAIVSSLAALFGMPAAPALPGWMSRAVITLMLFLAYELGYWFNHWLSHKVPLLWEFHKVHHTAEVLTPLTNFRVHPVYTFVFANIIAFSTAAASGLGHYMFGDATYQYALADTNLILVLFIHGYVHLQHSHVWIAFTGRLGRVLVSPAHHQVHHSANPKHFNKNFGSCLALWDSMFGTLYVPAKQREPIVFGVPGHVDAHTVKAELVEPFRNAARRLLGRVPKRFRLPQPLPPGAAVQPFDAAVDGRMYRTDAADM